MGVCVGGVGGRGLKYTLTDSTGGKCIPVMFLSIQLAMKSVFVPPSSNT